jgi:hypothetical protein
VSAAGLRAVQAGALAPVVAFADGLRHLSWFAAVGHELTAGERSEASDYLRAIALPDAEVVAVAEWRAAEAATRNARWSRAWWDAEECARSDLLARAGTLHDQRDLMAALSRVTLEASDVVLGAASIAAARSAIADPALARVAAGAATQAAYQAGLALAAGAGGMHPFAIKFRLFAAGRWPLGLVDQTFHVF